MMLVHPNRPLPDSLYHAQATAILQTFFPPPPPPPPRLTSDPFDSPVSVIPESPPFLTPAECDKPDYIAHAGTDIDTDPDTHDHDDIHTPAVTTPQSLHPPPPPISSAPFTSHITPSLALLADRLNPSRVYSPVYQMRDLHVLERGCWVLRFWLHSGSLDSLKTAGGAVWDTALFDRFWSFLSDFIAQGRAGWGVWAYLDRDPDPGPGPSPGPGPGDQQGHEDRLLLKVYTWGEVVHYIYILLFLASERRIRGLGASWCDAAERVVVQMS